MFSRCRDAGFEEVGDRLRHVPFATRSGDLDTSRGRNFRMVIVGLRGTSGGMTMFTREPSGRRASTYGDDSSTRRPSGAMIRSMIRMMWPLSGSAAATGR